MKRTTMILMVIAIALACWVSFLTTGYADPSYNPNVNVSDGTFEHGTFWDWWYSPWIPISNGTFTPGQEFTFTFNLMPNGVKLTDGSFDSDESFHVEVQANGSYALTVSASSFNGDTPIPGLTTSGEIGGLSHTYDSGNLQAGASSTATKLALKIKYTGESQSILQQIKFGYDAGNVNAGDGGGGVPEPATVISMLLGGAGFALRKLRAKKA